jgi:microcystin-dependent protein
MANYEATRYDFDGANLSGIEGIPTATIVPWSTASVPSGFLECNGSEVSRSTYATLFGIIGTTYGVGDGSTTFNVPDLQDNVAVGKSNNKTIGSAGGANTVSSTGNVGGSTANATLSTGQLASHSHSSNLTRAQSQSMGEPYTPSDVANAGYGSRGSVNFSTSNAGSAEGHSHNMSANFSGDATSVVQPYLTVMYIIKT